MYALIRIYVVHHYLVGFGRINEIKLNKAVNHRWEPPPLLNTPPYTYLEVENGQKETLQLLRR
jgi:hypothetical protein